MSITKEVLNIARSVLSPCRESYLRREASGERKGLGVICCLPLCLPDQPSDATK